jgi:hypothetical protein
LEVLFAQALTSGVPFSDLLNQRSREAEHRLAMERDDASYNLAKAMAQEELNEAGDVMSKPGLDPLSAQAIAMRNAKVAAEAEKLKVHQAERERAAQARRSMEASAKADMFRAKSLEHNVNFRSKKEPITKIQIKKYSDRVTPSIIIYRSGNHQLEDMVVDLEQIKTLGYTEWIEIHKLAQYSTSQHRDRVVAALTRLCENVAKLNVDLSNMAKADPLTEEQRDMVTKQRKKSRAPTFKPSPSSHTLIDQLLTDGGEMSKMNLTMPPNALEVDGLFLDQPEPGLVFRNLDKVWCFQRASELKYASPMHLYLLRIICNKESDVSEHFVKMIEAEAQRRNIDLTDHTGLYIKHGYLAHTQQD